MDSFSVLTVRIANKIMEIDGTKRDLWKGKLFMCKLRSSHKMNGKFQIGIQIVLTRYGAS